MKAKGILCDKQTPRGKKGFKAIVVLLLIVCIMSGCSTVGVYSYPSGARILVNEQDTGKVTPASLKARHLRPGRSYVTVEKEGYESLTNRQPVDVRVSVGNIIFSVLWPPVLFKNLFGNLWKGIVFPRTRHLEEFELQKISG